MTSMLLKVDFTDILCLFINGQTDLSLGSHFMLLFLHISYTVMYLIDRRVN